MREATQTSPPREVFLLPETAGAQANVFEPIEWTSRNQVRFLDQTRLPQEEVWVETAEVEVISEAIRSLSVRGAPLVGVTAAYAIAAVALNSSAQSTDALVAEVQGAAELLRATRPTAVNLAWAIDRMLARLAGITDVQGGMAALEEEAIAIHREDVAACERIGANGADLIGPGSTVLTHCNAGALATGGYGTALGVVRRAWSDGKLDGVIATETRPLLQGARLTAWELTRDGIPVTLISDGAAGHMMGRGAVSAVVTGADRIAANGDTANKIGTYQLAVLAREHGIPFYIAAPLSTIDLETASGDGIPIEERDPEEVRAVRGVEIAANVTVANPAFDVTPARFIAGIITEAGVATAPYQQSLPALFREKAVARG